MTQKGLTPILIVLILAALVGGYLIYQNQPKIISSPQPFNSAQDKPTTQPSPTPSNVIHESTTSAETANWKTYTNTKYGFRLKYPETATIDKEDDGVDIIVVPGVAFSVGSGSLFRVMILDNPDNLSLEGMHNDYDNSKCSTQDGMECEYTTVSGFNSLKVGVFATAAGAIGERYAYYIKRDNNIFRLSWFQGSGDEKTTAGDQILSTFKFLP